MVKYFCDCCGEEIVKAGTLSPAYTFHWDVPEMFQSNVGKMLGSYANCMCNANAYPQQPTIYCQQCKDSIDRYIKELHNKK